MNSFWLSDGIKVTVDAPTTAGTSEVDSTALDMTGFDEVIWIVHIGTASANNYAKAQEDTVVGMGTVQDLAGSKALSASGINNLIIDLLRPVKQFVRCAVIRGTSSTVDTIVAIQCKARNMPVSQLAASVLTQLNAPAEGTA